MIDVYWGAGILTVCLRHLPNARCKSVFRSAGEPQKNKGISRQDVGGAVTSLAKSRFIFIRMRKQNAQTKRSGNNIDKHSCKGTDWIYNT